MWKNHFSIHTSHTHTFLVIPHIAHQKLQSEVKVNKGIKIVVKAKSNGEKESSCGLNVHMCDNIY